MVNNNIDKFKVVSREKKVDDKNIAVMIGTIFSRI